MKVQVVRPSTEAEQWERGERLAMATMGYANRLNVPRPQTRGGGMVSLGWIRRHYGEITYKACQKVRREQADRPWPR